MLSQQKRVVTITPHSGRTDVKKTNGRFPVLDNFFIFHTKQHFCPLLLPWPGVSRALSLKLQLFRCRVCKPKECLPNLKSILHRFAVRLGSMASSCVGQGVNASSQGSLHPPLYATFCSANSGLVFCFASLAGSFYLLPASWGAKFFFVKYVSEAQPRTRFIKCA